jgi:hypothetical protein
VAVFRNEAKCRIRSIHCFDSINEKSQMTQEQLYPEEREREEELLETQKRWQYCK